MKGSLIHIPCTETQRLRDLHTKQQLKSVAELGLELKISRLLRSPVPWRVQLHRIFLILKHTQKKNLKKYLYISSSHGCRDHLEKVICVMSVQVCREPETTSLRFSARRRGVASIYFYMGRGSEEVAAHSVGEEKRRSWYERLSANVLDHAPSVKSISRFDLLTSHLLYGALAFLHAPTRDSPTSEPAWLHIPAPLKHRCTNTNRHKHTPS